MPRRPRLADDTHWHHVMNRGARKLPTFGDDDDRHAFLALLDDAHRSFGLVVHAYALMGNHFHLLVEASSRRVSASMQLVGGTYAQRFNRKYGFDGPLFRGRFKSKPVQDERYLAQLARYIHLNPVPADAGIVPLSIFRWTSHLAYAGMVRPPPWLTTGTILAQHGGDVAAYRRSVEGEGAAPVEALDLTGSATGVRMLTPATIEAALGIASPSEREVVVHGGRGVRNNLRLACVLLSSELTSSTAADLAQRLGFASPSGLRSARQRALELEAEDRGFATIVSDARSRLSATKTNALPGRTGV